VTSRTRPSFWRAYETVERAEPKGCAPGLHNFQGKPDHPSLRFKKLGGYDHVWSVRINEQYRAIGGTPW